MLLIIIDIILLTVLGGFMIYLATLSVFALFSKRQKQFSVKRFRKFAVVIPAHNEENSITSTINSISQIDYPGDNFDIIVVADNCTDKTVETANALKVRVMERNDLTHRGKGYALRWCFDKILHPSNGYDAVAVIDADTVVSKNYLTVINYYFENGSKVVQVNDMVAPNPGAWTSEVIRLGFTLYNLSRPLGRKLFNGTAGIRGNGMCFSTDVLKEVPWNTYSLNEDLEYGIIIFLNGINVDFAPETTIFATMPTHAKNAESQRARWEKGRFPVIKRYSGQLLYGALKKVSLRYCDLFLELIIPPFVNLFGAVSLLCLIHCILWLTGKSQLVNYTAAWILAVVFGIIHVIVGLIAARADKQLYNVIFQIPKYAIWKIYLYLKRFTKATTTDWIRTERENTKSDTGMNK